MTLTEKDIDIEIQTEVEGPLAVVGKTPRFRVGRLVAHFEGTPLRSVRVEIQAGSLNVISPEIGEADRRKILQTANEKILRSSRFPMIEFEASEFSISDEKCVKGLLRLRGVERRVDLYFHESGDRIVCRHGLRQTDYGITPASAMMGALRCRDVLAVEISLRLPAALALP